MLHQVLLLIYLFPFENSDSSQHYMKKYTLQIGIIFILFMNVVPGYSQSYLIETGIEDSVYSEILGEQRKLWIKYPKFFNSSDNRSYPVVYILDGETQLRALDAVFNYYEGHFLPDMILIGISSGHNRMRDLTTSKVSMRFGMPIEQETGGAENITHFIEQELIPHIDSILPTTNHRTLIGHSFGGLFTINTVLNHPDLFSYYIAIDPSLDWDNQELMKQSETILQKNNFEGKSLFVTLSTASLHMQDGSITIDNIMQDSSDYTLFARSIIEFSEYAESQNQNGLNFSLNYYPNDIHGSVSLPSIREGLIKLFNWYQLESFWKFNDFDTPTHELIELVERREKKLSDNFGYNTPPFDEELFNMLGYMALEMGQTNKSKAFFEMAIAYYRQGANAFDSMADYHISQNEKDEAVNNLKKAYELSGSERYLTKIEEIEKHDLKQ